MLYDKKKLPLLLNIKATIDKTPLTRIKEKRVLGINIDGQLSFTPHVQLTTKKCRSACMKVTLYPYLAPNVALQLYKAYIRYRLVYVMSKYLCPEYVSIISGCKILPKNHMKQLKSAQLSTLSLIQRTMKSTPINATEVELSRTPINLCLR